MAKSTKQSIRESFEKAQEKKRIREQLNSTNFNTSSLPAQATGKNKFQAVKDNARQAMQDIRNGHADWHEPYNEHDLPDNFREVTRRRRKSK